MPNFIKYQRFANMEDAFGLIYHLRKNGIEHRGIYPKQDDSADFNPYHNFTTLLVKEANFQKIHEIEVIHYKVNFNN